MGNFTIGDDQIDSRDVEDRINELESEIEDLVADRDAEMVENGMSDLYEELYEEANELQDELDLLVAFRDNVGSSEWSYGLQLINKDYFTEYAQQFAEDIGAVNSDASWPNTCIDWDEAAEELQMDYSCVDVQGEVYYYNG